jgi:hypothetical protein
MISESDYEVEIENSEVPDHFYGKLKLLNGTELHFTLIIDSEEDVPKIIWHSDKNLIGKIGMTQKETEYLILKERNRK